MAAVETIAKEAVVGGAEHGAAPFVSAKNSLRGKAAKEGEAPKNQTKDACRV